VPGRSGFRLGRRAARIRLALFEMGFFVLSTAWLMR